LDLVVLPQTNRAEKPSVQGSEHGHLDRGGETDNDPPANGVQTQKSRAASEDSSDSSSESAAKKEVAALRSLQTALANFRQLLEERAVGPFDAYETWLPRLSKDPRFLAVPQSKRKALFKAERQRLGAQCRQSASTARRSGSDGFQELLRTAKSQGLLRARTVAEALSAMERTDLATDSRWHGVSQAERVKFTTKAVEAERERAKRESAEAEHAFRLMIKERVLGTRDAEPPTWSEVADSLLEDPRCQALRPEDRERLYTELATRASQGWLRAQKRLAQNEDELSLHRKRSRQTESEGMFRSLLEAHVTEPLITSWSQARVLLAGLPAADLDDASQERLFNVFQQEEAHRKLKLFAHALRQAPIAAVGPEMNFDEVWCALTEQGDVGRFEGLAIADLKKVWTEWRLVALEEAKRAFRSLLQQSGHLFEAAADPSAREGKGPLFESLCERLSTDLRYQRLAPVGAERSRMITARLQEAVGLEESSPRSPRTPAVASRGIAATR